MATSQKKNAKISPRSSLNLMYVIAMIFFIVVALILFILSSLRSDVAKTFLEHGASLQILSQQIASNAEEAADGNQYGFSALNDTKGQFTNIWQKVSKAEINTFLMGQSFINDAAKEINAVENVWSSVRRNVDVILQQQKAVNDLNEVASLIERKIPTMSNDINRIVDTLVRTNASTREVRDAQELETLAEKILRGIDSILKGETGNKDEAKNFYSNVKSFADNLNALESNAVVRAQNRQELQNLKDEFKSIKDRDDLVLNQYEAYAGVKTAAANIAQNSNTFLTNISELTNKIDEEKSGPFSFVVGGAISSLLAVVFMFLMSFDSSRQAKARLVSEERVRREQEETNRRNQEAILRLLDELSALADGDLTIQTTVTGEFTGAICDSINFTIEQLRSLVSTINDTAVKVSGAAQETQATAMQLAEASEHQAQEISGASAAITEMAASIDQVSANASESTLVAERSVTIANKGSQVVHNTTKGMDTIREQIQETAKRIKRLGESSQEIGDIVSLITDIADQTNILALNAAIQASMAGDAGRGFAVVADEVQRLAERSSAATKQIEAIVRTIQTDTNEAVTSMEHTTAEVVRGTRLAQDAGIALEEIENVSRNLADLIQNISNAARQQSASAGHISNTMNVIQEITSQTSSGTIATAKSIGNLASLAVEMRKTVAGFKLPEN